MPPFRSRIAAVRAREGSGSGVNPLRLAAGLLRFGLALTGAAIRLVTAREPDPINLQPRVLQRSGPAADDGSET